MEIVVKEVSFGEPCSKVNICFAVAVFVWDKEPPTAGFKIFHGGTEIYKRVALWVLKRIIRSDKSHGNRETAAHHCRKRRRICERIGSVQNDYAVIFFGINRKQPVYKLFVKRLGDIFGKNIRNALTVKFRHVLKRGLIEQYKQSRCVFVG